MSAITEIFVELLGEHVDVKRPILATRLHEDVYEIVDQPYDRTVERWQFEPGDQVVCEAIDSDDGRILVATRRVERD